MSEIEKLSSKKRKREIYIQQDSVTIPLEMWEWKKEVSFQDLSVTEHLVNIIPVSLSLSQILHDLTFESRELFVLRNKGNIVYTDTLLWDVLKWIIKGRGINWMKGREEDGGMMMKDEETGSRWMI